MMGKSQQSEPKLFYHGISLSSRIGADHPLRKIKKLVDFNFIRSRVAELYGSVGNESVDPAVILKLMFLLFYENVASERALMQQLPLRLDWLWFCGYDLDDTTPDHSILSKARRRWGTEAFDEFFCNILKQCIKAGLVDGKIIHIDSSLINANASLDSLEPQFRIVSNELGAKLDQQQADEHDHTGSCRKISTTDPDARLAKKYNKTTLGYKDNRVVDDRCGIVTATITTPADIHDSKSLAAVIEIHHANTDIKVDTAVADKAYGNIENYKYLRENEIKACVPHQKYGCKTNAEFSHDKFTYDADNDCYICPAGQQLHRYDRVKPYQNSSYRYRGRRSVCEQCRFFTNCVNSKTSGRLILRNVDAEYVNWADTCLKPYHRRRLMARRKQKAEGSFADAANNHGFKHARWRTLCKVQIQNLMIAAIQNLRKLIAHSRGNSPLAVAAQNAKVSFWNMLKNLNRIANALTGNFQIT